VRQPFVEISGSIAFSSLCSFPGNCALFLCVTSRVHSNVGVNPRSDHCNEQMLLAGVVTVVELYRVERKAPLE